MTLRWVLWIVGGALSMLTVLAILSIGIFIAPFALAAVLTAVRWADKEPVGPGLIAGVGLTLIAIGVIQLGDRPVPWFVAGGVAGAVGLASASWQHRRRSTAP